MADATPCIELLADAQVEGGSEGEDEHGEAAEEAGQLHARAHERVEERGDMRHARQKVEYLQEASHGAGGS